MLIAKPETKIWLEHRLGIRRADKEIAEYKIKALELNKEGANFINTFGKKKFKSFVGFIDLAGFSTHVQDKPPEEIAKYLEPFIKGVVDIVTGRYGMVDKTIGDEIMFALPELPAAKIFMVQMLGGLHDLAFSLGNDYPYRIGLSYGDVTIDLVKGDNYSEWTLFGETIHVARRIMGLECISKPAPVVGAYGIKANNDTEYAKESVTNMLGFIAGFPSRWQSHLSDETISLKGGANIVYGYFKPKKDYIKCQIIDET